MFTFSEENLEKMPSEPQIIKAADETAVIEKLCTLIETKAKVKLSFYRQNYAYLGIFFAKFLQNFLFCFQQP
jgi:hypothetical protein